MSNKVRLQRLEKASPKKKTKAILVMNRDNKPTDEAIARHISAHPEDADADIHIVLQSLG